MRCKACGRVLPDGSKKCPHCGMIVPVGSGRPGEEFKWNIQEYPKPEEKKKVDVSIDWQSGQIVDRGTGRTYDQSAGTGWKEPEKARELFAFEKENEVLQKELDKKVDTIAETSPKERVELQDRRDIFSLPSQMEMNSFNDLINDEPAEPAGNMSWGLGFHDARSTETVQKREEPVYRPAPSAAEFIFGGRAKKDEPMLDWSLTPGSVGADTRAAAAAAAAASAEAARKAQQAAAEAAAKKQAEEVPPPARAAADGKYSVPKMMQEQQYDPFEDRKNWEQVHMPGFLQGGIRLIFEEPEVDLYEEVTEAASRDIGPSAGYMADAEEARAQETFQRLISVEQRFSEDMDRVVFMSEEEKELEKEAERKREELNEVPEVSYLTIEDEYDRYCTANGIPKAKPIEETEKKEETEKAKEEKQEPAEEAKAEPAAEKPREVNIRIKDDSSGTQYTVKTQDAPAEDAAESSVGRQTRTVQVSVAMDGGSGSSSVEVTSGADGATVVTTTDAGQADEAPAAEIEEDVPFWERKKPVSRMTITDIFGPEARDILNKPDGAETEETAAGEEAGDTKRIGGSGAETVMEDLPEPADAEEKTAAETEETEASESVESAEAAEADGSAAQAEEDSAEAEVESKAAEEAPADGEETSEAADAEEIRDVQTVAEAAEEPSAEDAAEEIAEETEAAAEETAEEAAEAEEISEEAEAETEGGAETAVEAESAVAEDGEETPEAAEAAEEPAAKDAAEEAAEKEEISEEAEAEPAAEESGADTPDESGAETEETVEEAAAKDGGEDADKVGEFIYTVDEDRMTKQEIREMSEAELVAAQKAAAEAERAKAEASKTAAEKTGVSDVAAKTEAPVEEKPEKERKLFRKAAKEKEEESSYKELDEDKIDRRAARAERIARKKAEEEEESSLSLKIMKIVIIVLIVAVVLEFLIFGIKLMAPDSMFGVLINKIESGITGASFFGKGHWRL